LDLNIFNTHFLHYHISALHDTGWPAGDHDLLQRVVLLVRPIKFNVYKVVLFVNEKLFVV